MTKKKKARRVVLGVGHPCWDYDMGDGFVRFLGLNLAPVYVKKSLLGKKIRLVAEVLS